MIDSFTSYQFLSYNNFAIPHLKERGVILKLTKLAPALLVFPLLGACSSNEGTQDIPTENPPIDESQENKEQLKEHYLQLVEEKHAEAEKLQTASPAITTPEYTELSHEVYTLWDEFLTQLVSEMEGVLSPAEYEKLLESHERWPEDLEQMVKTEIKDSEGGTAYQATYNFTAVDFIYDRCLEIVDMIN